MGFHKWTTATGLLASTLFIAAVPAAAAKGIELPPLPGNGGGDETPDAICSNLENWKDVECASGDPYERAKSTVLVEFFEPDPNDPNALRRAKWCSGVKVGCPGPNLNQFLTARHCIYDGTVWQPGDLKVTFDFQRTACIDGPVSRGPSYQVVEFVQQSFALDYVLFTAEVDAAADDYPAAVIDAAGSLEGALIYITHHPQRQDDPDNPTPRKLTDHNSDSGLCDIDGYGVPSVLGGGDDAAFSYHCSAAGGSSGGPVWSDSYQKLIGLHHAKRCVNEPIRTRYAVRMDLIYPEIQPLIQRCSNTPCDDDWNCDDNLYCTGNETCNSETGFCDFPDRPEDCHPGKYCREEEQECEFIPSCPASWSCSGPSCQPANPMNCVTYPTAQFECVNDNGDLLECSDDIWITNCDCEATVPGSICVNQSQSWECRQLDE